MRGATRFFRLLLIRFPISIHAPRERSDLAFLYNQNSFYCISIHAPRERSDAFIFVTLTVRNCISIHAPRERSDYISQAKFSELWKFQSTLLVRGATALLTPENRLAVISIHAPRERSDIKLYQIGNDKSRFQSTLLVRGATAESTKNIRNQYLFCTNTGFSLIFFNVFGREKHHFISFFIANLMFAWHSLRISYHHKASKFPLLHNVLFWTCNCFPDYIF